MDEFAFETAQKVFNHGIVVGVASAGRALAYTKRIYIFPIDLGRERNSTVAMEEQVFGRLAPMGI